jgi:hypothetical protein
MTAYTRVEKIELGELLADGLRKFGKVLPRRPYKEDDEGGGEGSNMLLEHPLFMDVQLGAPSDLTTIASENNHSKEEAEKRADELTPQLQKSLQNQLALGYQKAPEARAF